MINKTSMEKLENYYNEIKLALKGYNDLLWEQIKNKENDFQTRWDLFCKLVLTQDDLNNWVQHYTYNGKEISWYDDCYIEKYMVVDNMTIIHQFIDMDDYDGMENYNQTEFWSDELKNLAKQMFSSGERWWKYDW